MNAPHQKTRGRRRLTPLSPARIYRVNRGITLEALAARLKIPTSRLSKLERDPDQLSEAQLERLIQAVDELFAVGVES